MLGILSIAKPRADKCKAGLSVVAKYGWMAGVTLNPQLPVGAESKWPPAPVLSSLDSQSKKVMCTVVNMKQELRKRQAKRGGMCGRGNP